MPVGARGSVPMPGPCRDAGNAGPFMSSEEMLASHTARGGSGSRPSCIFCLSASSLSLGAAGLPAAPHLGDSATPPTRAFLVTSWTSPTTTTSMTSEPWPPLTAHSLPSLILTETCEVFSDEKTKS